MDLLHVPAYPKEYCAGGQALAALHAALRSLNVSVSYAELSVLSGTAFRFVYDNAPVFEPLRDLFPLDPLLTGTRAVGYNGSWVTDQPALASMATFLERGRPAVASLYSVAGHHGFAVAVGYDAAAHRLFVQADERSLAVDLPQTWWGAVTGPVAWAQSPFFLIAPQPLPGWTAQGRLSRALARGAALIQGGQVAYRDCEGAREFSAVPLAGRNALYGLPALDLLAAEIGGAEWLGDFALIWRLDAQVGQLVHSRRAAADFFRTVAHPLAGEAHDLCRQSSDLAADLQARFWFRPSRAATTAVEVMSLAGSSAALIFWLGLSDEERTRLGTRMPLQETPWGWITLHDAAPRRREAVALVAQIRQAEERLASVLLRLAGAL